MKRLTLKISTDRRSVSDIKIDGRRVIDFYRVIAQNVRGNYEVEQITRAAYQLKRLAVASTDPIYWCIT